MPEGMNVYLADISLQLRLSAKDFDVLMRLVSPPIWTINAHMYLSRGLFLDTMKEIDVGHHVGLMHRNTSRWHELHPWRVSLRPDHKAIPLTITNVKRMEVERLDLYTDMLGVTHVEGVLDSAMAFYLYVCRHLATDDFDLCIKTPQVPAPSPFFFS